LEGCCKWLSTTKNSNFTTFSNVTQILLDEADIFLEERSKNDIARNAMVRLDIIKFFLLS